jgi:hypothetical protein
MGAATAVAAGATVGVVIGYSTHKAKPAPPPEPPQELVNAIAHEVGLIALIDSVTAPSANVAPLLAQARADHVEHERVLRGLLPYGTAPVVIPSASTAPTTVQIVRSAEKRAAQAAAEAAAKSDGSTAVLLACISACEDSHAELLA